ncbi:hypothetical protein DSO57_1026744 [Entomophthora muscae]|uniref:Uncharacterized protein n=1 Tax=Entomophthora muscae TaxID=34485 RepID=A0ACC2RH07_9FUNG|nr:hypothetical protein DSO57_1026744 [Entomophthora muscae]
MEGHVDNVKVPRNLKWKGTAKFNFANFCRDYFLPFGSTAQRFDVINPTQECTEICLHNPTMPRCSQAKGPRKTKPSVPPLTHTETIRPLQDTQEVPKSNKWQKLYLITILPVVVLYTAAMLLYLKYF